VRGHSDGDGNVLSNKEARLFPVPVFTCGVFKLPMPADNPALIPGVKNGVVTPIPASVLDMGPGPLSPVIPMPIYFEFDEGLPLALEFPLAEFGIPPSRLDHAPPDSLFIGRREARLCSGSVDNLGLCAAMLLLLLLWWWWWWWWLLLLYRRVGGDDDNALSLLALRVLGWYAIVL